MAKRLIALSLIVRADIVKKKRQGDLRPPLVSSYILSVSVYPEKVTSRALAPNHRAAECADAAVGRSASFICGCYVAFSAKVDQGRFAVSFSTNGCGYLIAAADVLAELFSSHDPAKLHGLDHDELHAVVRDEIGSIPAGRFHCANICIEALRSTFAILRASRIEEFRGEGALVCTCFGISEETIETFIAANRDIAIEDVAESCRAGSGCGSCRMLIQELIDSAADV